MIKDIKGLHHVTSMTSDAHENNRFFTDVLGLRRVKKTVNFDDPSVYHLYYGDERGTPGTVMTYFPFSHMMTGRPGAGEVGEIQFSVPKGSLAFWKDRLIAHGVGGIQADATFGVERLRFAGPDGDGLALIETVDDPRAPWLVNGISEEEAIRGFSGARLNLHDTAATEELLRFMGYERAEAEGDVARFITPSGNGAATIDLVALPQTPFARQGAGSVHHIAFAVENREKQLEVRKALMDTGYQVTPVIDRDYFWAIYFRTPGGILFEIATNEPGFDRDEDTAHLGEALKLPARYEPFRGKIEAGLEPLAA
ncbi:dioxygenase [Sinorhizobium medicae]|uniref:Putative ring-cleaving dioxygenase MhqO n=1 Tax=Sinorhizobium medicae TaxID=110321 RepID=A0A508X151_9HYPH|nr:VOC family protein [Sinorhizobium medicae]MBO1961584.1 VOC family protein [Sinorhizobium medicae]MDX0520093.1 ring-cleaving dioxygenase [Sinorhizobium medicae]MDX0547327.1 ring-cleaving dioxygenase [Sinorhizobium medicae]MDX0631447.1 ring-cleaving dioxygenase [Sinorhizobium medicae]MDX0712309.1 ring-cleaving dioxygenase [Sinorhizobium medicae]